MNNALRRGVLSLATQDNSNLIFPMRMINGGVIANFTNYINYFRNICKNLNLWDNNDDRILLDLTMYPEIFSDVKNVIHIDDKYYPTKILVYKDINWIYGCDTENETFKISDGARYSDILLWHVEDGNFYISYD